MTGQVAGRTTTADAVGSTTVNLYKEGVLVRSSNRMVGAAA